LQIREGSAPANCSASSSGSLILNIVLPAIWMASASAGAGSMNGTWSGSASGSGTAGHFRIVDATASACHMQGTVTVTAGGGDLTLDNIKCNESQTVTITTFTLTAPGA
jgi:hypothetical protein